MVSQYCPDYPDPPELYGFIDENRSFFGFAGIEELVDLQRTLFFNGLDDVVVNVTPINLPSYLVLDGGVFWNGVHEVLDESSNVTVVPQGNLPLEIEANFATLTKGNWFGTIEFVVTTHNCTLPSALLPYTIQVENPDLNHLGGLLGVGWSFVAFTWLACGICLIWMYANRHIRAIKLMQPLFLAAVTIGVAILGATILCITITDENASLRAADAACVALPWCIVTGFTVISSALFSKFWRINKLFHGAHQCRRLRVTERDVIGPFLLWFFSNTVFLALRTALGAPRLVREEIDDNPANTISYCDDSDESVGLFALANILITLSAFVACAYQAYKARDISDQFSESKTLGIAIVIWLQILVISVPVLVLVGFDSPTTSYFVGISMVFGLCVSMLGAIFLPLWLQVRKLKQTGRAALEVVDQRISVASPGAVHISGLPEQPDAVQEPPSVLLGRSSRKTESSEHTESLVQQVFDLQNEVSSLKERNQELESLLRDKTRTVDDTDATA